MLCNNDYVTIPNRYKLTHMRCVWGGGWGVGGGGYVCGRQHLDKLITIIIIKSSESNKKQNN